MFKDLIARYHSYRATLDRFVVRKVKACRLKRDQRPELIVAEFARIERDQ